MDQVKEYLKIALQHRFWIAVGIAAILPIVGYFLASGSIAEEEQRLTSQVKAGIDAVKKFESNTRPVNQAYKPLVETETAALKKDVDTSWRKLYSRQAPLLTWPDAVADTFAAWGRKWPENTQASFVEQTIIDYVETFDDYVREVYESFSPFDPETGEGIVAAPPAEVLLRPPVFSIATPPSLGKVWAAQEKLWIQRSVLEVLGRLNEKAGAKDWQSAPLKQLLALEVANANAQDQKSLAKSVALVDADDVTNPSQPTAAAPAKAAGASDNMQMMAMMGGGRGAGMMIGSGGASSTPEVVQYLSTDNKDQLSVAPIYLSVYVQQDAIPDLLVEFQNSPMDIQVLEVAVIKPAPFSVKKPVKGQTSSAGMMGMAGMMMGRGAGRMADMMAGGYAGGGDPSDMMRSMMRGTGNPGYGPPDTASMMAGMMGRGRAAGLGSGTTAATPKREGRSVQQENIAKREAALKAKQKEQGEAEEEAPPTQSDPYYDVVELRIYGQARFYKTPPPEAPSPSSSFGAPALGSAETATNDAAAAEAGTAPVEALQPAAAPAAETLPAAESSPAPAPESADETQGAVLPDAPAPNDSDAPGSDG